MAESGGPGGRRSLRADAARNQQRILLAAREALVEAGGGITLEDVARRADVGVATIYRRFAGRRDLVRAVLDQYLTEEIEPLLRAAGADDDPWHGLCRALEHTVATVVANEAMLRAVRENGLTAGEVEPRFFAPLAPVLRRAQQSGRARPDLTPEDLPVVVLMAVAAAQRTGPGMPVAADWGRYLHLALTCSHARAGAASSPGELPE